MSRLVRPVILFAALFALAGCTAGPTPGSDPSSGSEGSNPSASASAPSEEDFSDLSPYYPIAVGNTWIYTITYSDGSTVVDTEVMTKVVAEGDGARVTFERSFDWNDESKPDFSDSVDYVFHADGSLSVPFQSVPIGDGGSTLVVKSGALEWPTTAEFEAGTPKTGTIETTSTSADGTVIDQSIAFTITGEGVEAVTVPFDTFQDARKLHQALLVSVPSLGVTDLPIDSTTWLVEGVGPVRTEIPDLFGQQPTIQELVDFTLN